MQGITIFMRLVGGQQVAREARDVEGGIDRVTRSAGRLKFAGEAAFIALGAALAAGATTGIQYNAQIETLNTSFSTLLDSQRRATEYVEYLKREGASTPFEISDLATASQTLLGFNFSLKETKDLLDTLGNTTSALGKGAPGLQSLALIFGQIRAKGRLQGDEVLQLAENGLPAGEVIRASMGLSKKDFQRALEGGKVDADTAINALTRYMNREYAGAMDRQSRTLAGQFSTFQDNLKMSLGGASSPISDWLKETGLPEANQFFKDLGDSSTDAGKALQSVRDTTNDIADAFKKAADDAQPFWDNVLEPLLKLTGALMSEVFKNAPAVIGAIGDALGAVGDAAGTLGDGLEKVFKWGEKLGILGPGGQTIVEIPDNATTPKPAPSMVPGRKAPKANAPSKEAPKAPTKKKSPNPLNVPNVLNRGMGGDINITVPLTVDNRKIGEANARARADERARR